MRKIIISEFLTVDGMIADPAGKMDWAKDLFNDEMLKEISNRRKQVDTLLLGRHTYEMMEKYCAGVLPVTEDRATIRYMNSVSKFVYCAVTIDNTTRVEWRGRKTSRSEDHWDAGRAPS